MVALVMSGLLASLLDAQPVRVITEFARFTPSGELFPQDQIRRPMEVLSPPLVRGAWNAFRIVVDAEPGQDFQLFIGQNPHNAMRVRVMREVPALLDGRWVVARREQVLLPFRSDRLPAAERSATRKAYTFWLEVQPPRRHPSSRLKLEPQVLVGKQWFIYPLEVRVLELDINLQGLPTRAVPDLASETPEVVADEAYTTVLEGALCGDPDASFPRAAGAEEPRNREREAASVFARSLDALARMHSREDVEQGILSFLKVEDRIRWCRAPTYPRDRFGAEWPAALRNRLLQLAGDPFD